MELELKLNGDDAGPPPKITAAQTRISEKLPPQMLAPPTS